MCNKCENTHCSFFKKHHTIKLNKDEETFMGYCKEKDHQKKLEYYCKNHNQLCCLVCIAIINKKGYGQHKDCEVCEIEKIKDDKKNKLKENIKSLENLENNMNENIKELKDIFEKIEKGKEDLKIKVLNIFTKIRTTLNERETQLLLEIDNLYTSKYFNEDIIKKAEKLPKQIKISLEKGKLIDKEWDNDNLHSYINDCINIENNINQNIKELKDIFEKIEKDKEDLKIKVLNIFTKIRTILNERETQLLLEIDNLYTAKYFNEDIINLLSIFIIYNK
jgi:hypothetical protein